MEEGLDKLHGGLLFGEGVLGPTCALVGACGAFVVSALGYAGAVFRQRLRVVGWCAVMAPVAIQVLASWEWLLIAVCFSCPVMRCCLTFGPLRRLGGFCLSAVQVNRNLRHMLAAPSSSTWTRPGYRSLPGWALYSVLIHRGQLVPALSPGAGGFGGLVPVGRLALPRLLNRAVILAADLNLVRLLR